MSRRIFNGMMWNITNGVNYTRLEHGYSENVTRVCDASNITSTDIPIYKVHEISDVLMAVATMNILDNYTSIALANSKDLPSFCSNKFNSYTLTTLCFTYNLMNEQTPINAQISSFFSSYNQNQTSVPFFGSYINISRGIELANQHDQNETFYNQSMDDFMSKFNTVGNLYYRIKEAMEDEVVTTNIEVTKNFFRYQTLERIRNIVDDHRHSFVNNHYYKNNIAVVIYNAFTAQKVKDMFNSFLDEAYFIKENLRDIFFVGSLKAALKSKKRRNFITKKKCNSRGYFSDYKRCMSSKNNGFEDSYNNTDLNREFARHISSKKELYLMRYAHYHKRLQSYRYHKMTHAWDDQIHDKHERVKGYHHTNMLWDGFSDNVFDISSLKDDFNGVSYFFSWLFHVNKFNSTGLNPGSLYLPDSRIGAIYPTFIASKNFSLTAIIFPNGFNVANPQCGTYASLPGWAKGFTYLSFTPLFGKFILLHPKSPFKFLVDIGANNSGFFGLLPPNLIICLLIEFFYGLIFLLFFWLAFLIVIAAMNAYTGIRHALDAVYDRFRMDQFDKINNQ